MALRTLMKFRNPDTTSDLNHRTRNLIEKGVFFGGTVQPVAGILAVDVQPFAAMGFDGMVTLLEGAAERLTVLAGATNLILLNTRYNANQPPTSEMESLTQAEFDALSTNDKQSRILFATVTLPGGATSVLSSQIDVTAADVTDRQGRFFLRGSVENTVDLPDFTEPPTGITTQNREGDVFFVRTARVFFSWDTSGTPAWLQIISSASEAELLNHRQNGDDGAAPDFVNAQHVLVIHRQSLDEGSASTKTFPVGGTAFGAGNAFLDEKYPIALRKKDDKTGLGSAVEVAILGNVFVGNGGLNTAKDFIRLAVVGEDKQLLGGDNVAITVLRVEDSSAVQINPSTDADPLGFVTDPVILFDLGATTDVGVSDVSVWHYTRKLLGQLTPTEVAEAAKLGGFIDPATVVPTEAITTSSSLAVPSFTHPVSDVQTTLEEAFTQISRRVAKSGDVMEPPAGVVFDTLTVRGGVPSGDADGGIAIDASGGAGGATSTGGIAIIATGGTGQTGGVGVFGTGGVGTSTGGIGIQGQGKGTSPGVRGDAEAGEGGIGVLGVSDSGDAVRGTASNAETGVRGQGGSSDGDGVRGEGGGALGAGVIGIGGSGAGQGVFGSSTTGFGVEGVSASGVGVSGRTTANEAGAVGTSTGTGTGAVGVKGVAILSGSGKGVEGTAGGPTSIAVHGDNLDRGIGVRGDGGNSSTGAGGAGGSFEGGVTNLAVTGVGGAGVIATGGFGAAGTTDGGAGIIATGGAGTGAGAKGGPGAIITGAGGGGGPGDAGAFITGGSGTFASEPGGDGVHATGGDTLNGVAGDGIVGQGGEETGSGTAGAGGRFTGGTGTLGGDGLVATAGVGGSGSRGLLGVGLGLGTGIQGDGGSTGGSGILGRAFAGTGAGVVGSSSGPGPGLRGFNTSTGSPLSLDPKTEPSSASNGDVYVDSGNEKIHNFYNSAWGPLVHQGLTIVHTQEPIVTASDSAIERVIGEGPNAVGTPCRFTIPAALIHVGLTISYKFIVAGFKNNVAMTWSFAAKILEGAEASTSGSELESQASNGTSTDEFKWACDGEFVILEDDATGAVTHMTRSAFANYNAPTNTFIEGGVGNEPMIAQFVTFVNLNTTGDLHLVLTANPSLDTDGSRAECQYFMVWVS